MTAFHWKVVGVIALALAAIMALQCGVNFNGPLRSCMRESMHATVASLLNLAGFGLAAWAGVATARRTRRTWPGWVMAVVAAIAITSFLTWVGFDMPTGGGEY